VIVLVSTVTPPALLVTLRPPVMKLPVIVTPPEPPLALTPSGICARSIVTPPLSPCRVTGPAIELAVQARGAVADQDRPAVAAGAE
jgi:hypothetical protein